jgi:hypothetical protein
VLVRGILRPVRSGCAEHGLLPPEHEQAERIVKKERIVHCGSLGIDILGPKKTSLRRIRLVDRLVYNAMVDVAKQLNAGMYSQMEGFKVVVDMLDGKTRSTA